MKSTLKQNEDYVDFQDDLIHYIDWLENNSIDHKDRIKVNALLMKWAEGTANVTISIEPYLLNYIKKKLLKKRNSNKLEQWLAKKLD